MGITGAALLMGTPRHLPEKTMPTAVGDAGQLFHVDVHELTAAGGVDASHHPSCGPIHPTQPVHTMAHQDPVHAGGRDPQDPADARRAQLACGAKPEDPGLA